MGALRLEKGVPVPEGFCQPLLNVLANTILGTSVGDSSSPNEGDEPLTQAESGVS